MKKRLHGVKHKVCQIEIWVMQNIDANDLQVSFKNEKNEKNENMQATCINQMQTACNYYPASRLQFRSHPAMSNPA